MQAIAQYSYTRKGVANVLTEYRENWDRYWSSIHDPSEVLWNVPHPLGVKLDFERFQPFFKDSHLPLID
ncbi:MAG: hypothetical protein QNJ63_09000 [Calothrix sp. MO_192.B10]|nr:hypothetical protein [Calothrix sp. MO_192.B10]